MCSYDLTRIRPFPDFVGAIQNGKHRDELYKNDGVVPVFSQWHPLSCRYVIIRTKTIRPGTGTQLMSIIRSFTGKQSAFTIEH